MIDNIPQSAWLLIAALIGWLVGSGSRRKYDAELRRIERKLDLLMKNNGIEYNPGADIPAHIIQKALNGEKIAAIKLYREHARVGLKEAKDAIEEILASRQSR